MRILILGGSGMLGHKAFQVMSERHDTFATCRSADGQWRTYPMFSSSDRVVTGVHAADWRTAAEAVQTTRPDVVLNCIGVIKQLPGAKDAEQSITVNALFPQQMARFCREVGVRFIQISTDCVFGGSRGMYTEEDVADARDLYGLTKYLGEVHGPGALTLRTSIIGRDFAGQASLLEWFLAQAGGEVSGFTNAVFSGFPTLTLARVIEEVITEHPTLSGLYHVASSPIDKHDLLCRIQKAMAVNVTINPVELERSIDRSLDASKFEHETRIASPSWDELIAQLASDQTQYREWKDDHATA